MYELKQGTARIVSVMEQYKDDPAAVNQMAHALHYMPEQLAQDMQALTDFHRLFDRWSNNAAAGYAIAAAQAVGLDHRQTAKLIDAMTAAFENMTVDEARELYESEDL